MSDMPDDPDGPGTQPAHNEYANVMTQVMVLVDSMLAPILEAAVGYKARAKDAGFSDKDAGQMAADYHHIISRLAYEKVLGPKLGG